MENKYIIQHRLDSRQFFPGEMAQKQWELQKLY